MSRWRPRRVRLSLSTVIWVTVLWMLLWGEFSWTNLIAGALIGVIVPSLFPFPRLGARARVRPGHLVALVYRFLVDLALASFHVAFLAINPRRGTRGAVIRVELRSELQFFTALTGIMASLIPGSVVVEALRRNSMLYVHILDVEAMGGIEKVRQDVLGIEKRLLLALASEAELVKVGLRGEIRG